MTTGQQLGVDMANTFMLTLLFNLIADMSENPDGFRADTKTAPDLQPTSNGSPTPQGSDTDRRTSRAAHPIE
jgi:hypothetical protein